MALNFLSLVKCWLFFGFCGFGYCDLVVNFFIVVDPGFTPNSVLGGGGANTSSSEGATWLWGKEVERQAERGSNPEPRASDEYALQLRQPHMDIGW